jgi:hypothetical protein
MSRVWLYRNNMSPATEVSRRKMEKSPNRTLEFAHPKIDFRDTLWN